MGDHKRKVMDLVTEQDLERLPSGGTIHIYPLFGREHDASPSCWCDPEPFPDEPRCFLHHPDN